MSTTSTSPAPISSSGAPTGQAPALAAVPDSEVAREKKGFKGLIVIAVIAASAFGGYSLYSHLTKGIQSTDDAQVEADVVPLAARVGGLVAQVKVQDNSRVKKGDVIALIDPADLQARVKQAEGELSAAKAQAAAADAQAQVSEAGARGGLSTAKAQVSTSQAQVLTSDAQIASARAQLVRAQADLKRSLTDLERTKQLRAANAVPQERLDNAQVTVDASQANLQAAQAQLAATEEAKRVAQSRVAEAAGLLDTNTPVDAKVAAAKASAELAHARVTTAEAALDLAKLNLSYTTVTAPADGVVSRLMAREGQLVSPGQALASVVPDHTYLVANFKETQVGAMKAGQKVEVELDAFPGQALHGTVESLAGGTGSRFSLLPPDNASGNFVKVVQRVPVRIAWTELPKGLQVRAGMSAVVSVKTDE
jgi:membrane fusion protein (multidrug efflux system)